MISENWKKILFIILFLAVTILLGWLLYYLVVGGQPTTPTTDQTTEQTTGGLPTAQTGDREATVNVDGQLVPAKDVTGLAPAGPDEVASGGRTKVDILTDQSGQGATLSADGQNVLFYQPSDGKFYSLSPDGNVVSISDEAFRNVDNILWAPNTQKAILEFPDGSNILYNFKTKEKITLPRHWEQFSYDPGSTNIAFKSMALDPENRWLAISKDDGTNIKLVEPLGEEEGAVAMVDWSPNNQIIATYTKSVDLERTNLYFLGANDERFRNTLVEGRDVRPIWSPQGDVLVYSAYHSMTNLNPNLWVTVGRPDSLGSDRRNLNLQTWADKCTYNGNATLYCAVPQYLPKGAGLIPEVAANTPDDFYRVDLTTGTKSLIAVPDGTYIAKDLVVSSDGRYLYFTDQVSGRLAKITLK